ncbi:MAG TPA: hypothetical protein DEB39_03210 [Planctomycetaceae bacterium]|nr:hypothetical protein [Planctomycetaceae bacterium]
MSRWNWVLLTLIIILVFPNIYFLLQATSVENFYRPKIEEITPSPSNKAKGETGSLEKTEKDIRHLREGDSPEKPLAAKTIEESGIDDLRAKLRNILNTRRQAWFGCTLANVTEDGEEVQPSLDQGGEQQPLPLLTLRVNAKRPESEDEPQDLFDIEGIVYLFAEREEKAGAYLGSFTVVNPTPESNFLTLVSAEVLSEEEVELIRQSAGPNVSISVYSALPVGRDLSFYEPDASGDAKEEGSGKYRDYSVLLASAYRGRYEYQRAIRTVEENIETLEEALNDAEKERQFWDEEQELERKRITAMKVQADEVQTKVGEIDALIGDIEDKIEKTQYLNEKLVAEIAEIQQETARQINQHADSAAEAVDENKGRDTENMLETR